MTRESLVALGLDKKHIDAIMSLHGQTVNPLNTQITTLTADNTKLKTDLESAQGEINSITETYSNDQEAYKPKYEAEVQAREAVETKYNNEVAAHNTTKTNHEAEKTNAAVDKVYAELLTASGLRSDLIQNELKLANRETLKLDDKDPSKLKDADKVLADAKVRWPKDFAEAKEGGATAFSSGNSFAAPEGDKSAAYNSRLEEARKAGNTHEAIKIKNEAAKEGVFLV